MAYKHDDTDFKTAEEAANRFSGRYPFLKLVYDGTFKGFLCALGCAHNLTADFMNLIIVPSGRVDGELFAHEVPVRTELGTALRTKTWLAVHIGKQNFDLISCYFRSDKDDKEKLIVSFLALIDRYGPGIGSDLSEETVLRMTKIRERVLFEAHKFLGLLRFREQKDGTLYAPIEPDNAILDLIAPHFADRFPTSPWVIHDLKRRTAAVWNCVRIGYARNRLPDWEKAELRKSEEHVQDLWKTFFQHTTNENRENPTLQSRFVPTRYRKHMPEMR